MLNIEKITPIKILYVMTVLILVATIFYPTYLPMADLPQHAGQVSILDDLLKKRSIWVDFLEINWNTPYLIGYLSWLLLYQVFDIVWAGKILLAMALISYVIIVVVLRKSFNASKWVDWIALPSFFGLAYEWGFITYLVAIPIGLYFFWLNKRWVEQLQPSKKSFVFLALVGTVMCFSHMLVFTFFCLLAFCYVLSELILKSRLLKQEYWQQNCAYMVVYIWFAVLLLLYLMRQDPLVEAYYGPVRVVNPDWDIKLQHLMFMPWHMVEQEIGWTCLSYILLILPFLSKQKLTKNASRYVPLAVFLIVWFALPSHMHHTSLVYERYAIFSFVFYYLIFDKNELKSTFELKLYEYGSLFLGICSILLLSKVIINHFYFDKEVQNFKNLLEWMPPQQRILYLQSDGYQIEANGLTSTNEYLYFASWYQA